MKSSLSADLRGLLAFTFLSAALAVPTLRADDAAPVVAKPEVNAPVTVTDNGDSWTLDNGLIKATIRKSGNMSSLVYQGTELIGRGGNWESTPSGEVTRSVRIDPASNGGDRAEISVKGVNGKMDIELRYDMERGVSGFYTYGIYSHGAGYPPAGFGENRFCIEGRPVMDWLSVDADRNMLMCSDADEGAGVVIHAKEQRILSTGIYKNSVEHKYSYCAVLYRTPAWGWCVRYPLLFPNDITYTIGQSDYHKDWFFEQVPHGESTAWLNPDAKDPANQPFGWVHAGTPGQDMWRTIGHGRADTWTIKFNMDKASQGHATLRLALAGADGAGGLAIAVNGHSVGTIYPTATNALRYNADKGVWQERDQAFDATLLKPGENQMQLTVPAGDLTSGVVYDYLRLELDENHKFISAPAAPLTTSTL